MQPAFKELVRARAKRVGFIRVDAKLDAEAELKVKAVKTDVALPNQTSLFLGAIKHKVPEDGRVIFQNIPLFASPGDGKTVTALTIVMELLEFHGPQNCNVVISDHIPTAIDKMREDGSPVQILFIDDALKSLSSRGGGNTDLLESIGLFTTMRHEFEEAHDTLNGIVYVISTSQMYKGLEKVFREGIVIFKSALESDKDEIMSATGLGKRAWDYLLQVLRDVKVHHRKARMNDSVVKLPGYPAGKLHLPPQPGRVLDKYVRMMAADMDPKETYTHVPVLDENGEPIMKRVPSPSEEGDYVNVPVTRPVTVQEHVDFLLTEAPFALKYKFIERAWKVDRTRMTKEERLQELNRNMDRYARWFAEENNADTASAKGKGELRNWLDRHGALSASVRTGQDYVSTEDYWMIREPKHFKAFAEKVSFQRRGLGKELLVREGVTIDGSMTDNDLIDYVADVLLQDGFDPFDKDVKQTFMSRIYKLPPEIQADAARLQAPLKSRVHDKAMRGAYGFSKSRPAPSEEGASEGLRERIAEGLEFDGTQFEVNAAELLDKLIDEARLAGPAKAKRYRELMVFKACKFLQVQYAGRLLNSPNEIANTDEGVAWQTEFFEHAYGRPEISKNRKAGEGFLFNEVGLLFEMWVEEKLRQGYIVPGVFDKKGIAKVHRAGGNRDDPDVVITYDDGTKDYVSLKCYTNREPYTITMNPSKGDEVRPERNALRADEAAGVKGSRFVVLARNLAIDGLQVVLVCNRSVDIPMTMGVNHADTGKWPWVKPAGQAG